MHKVLLASLFSLGLLNAPAIASAACIPTKSVSAAKAEYEMAIATSAQTLKSNYERALALQKADLNRAQKGYDQDLLNSRDKFAERINALSAKRFEPGWREAADAAAQEHNNENAQAVLFYERAVSRANVAYDDSVKRAQSYYNSEVASAAAQHNQAVCAQP